jgi:HEAT repeat protein
MIQKDKKIVQHVQNNAESVSPARIPRSRPFLKYRLTQLTDCLTRVVASRKPSPSIQSKQQNIPSPMEMSDLLTGRFRGDVSQPSPSSSKPETNSLPGDGEVNHPVEDTVFPDQRARLFARLGIKSEEIAASPDDIERLIASLSHIEVKQRINAAHAIADIYKELPPEKQMHARINLILMAWRDANAYARIAAIKALGRTETPDVSEALQVALRDEEQDVRAAAARALGEIRGKTSVVALISAAMRPNEHWSVRAAAIRAMGASGERAFLNTINLALEDEDDSVRIAALHALAQLEGLQAAPRLALIAQRDSQPHVKHAAILELEDLSAGD